MKKKMLTMSNFISIEIYVEVNLIIFRHHTFKKSAENKNEIDLDEVGPRFEMKCKFYVFLFCIYHILFF